MKDTAHKAFWISWKKTVFQTDSVLALDDSVDIMCSRFCYGISKLKATGPDGIPAYLLEVTADEAAVGLQLIFQAAILLIIRKPEAYTRWQ